MIRYATILLAALALIPLLLLVTLAAGPVAWVYAGLLCWRACRRHP